MEHGAHVRLRSRVHGWYLHADEDGTGVSLHRWRPRTMNAAWKVHRVLHDGSTNVLLHSAAYGRYLAASNDAAPPGHIGLRVELGDYDQDVDPILRKVGGYVLLHTVSNLLLRANGRYRLWLSGVSVDDVDNQHWKVETIPTSPNPPALQRTPHNWRRSFRGLFLLHEEAVQLQRTIWFVRADNHGNYPDKNWGTFQFQGCSVFELRAEVARCVGNVFMFFRILMCVQGGLYERLTPLLVDLPRNEETVDIIVLIIGTEGFTLSIMATSQERLTPDPSDDQLMDMVLSHDVETEDIYCAVPSRIALHGLPSRITDDQIGSMRVFLMCAEAQHFLNVFNACLEPIVDEVEQRNSYGEFIGNPMQQTVSSTCAIVSSAKCVEMQHRREYETYYGIGTFPCEAASLGNCAVSTGVKKFGQSKMEHT